MSDINQSGSEGSEQDPIVSNGSSTAAEEEATTFELYKGTLTFNVISRYDPAISQLLHISPYCVVYEYVEEDGSWSKAGFQGSLAVYSRNCVWDDRGLGFDKTNFKPHEEGEQNVLDIQESFKVATKDVVQNDLFYKFGLIVLNRLQPENFSIGILGDQYLQKADLEAEKGMFVEVMEEIVIVRDFNGKVWGLWLYDVNDREIVSKLLTYCLKN